MSEPRKPRVCYILPNDDPDTGSHFFHIYELISRSAEELDIRLIIERPSKKRCELLVPYYCQIFSFPPLRFLELFFVLIGQCLSGRIFFYTHYSFYGALSSWLATRLFGGTAYYWNCGMPWLFCRSWLEETIFRFILCNIILVTGTAGLAKEYSHRYGLDPSRIRVLPNWINLSRFRNTYDRKYFRIRLGIPVDVKVVLFVHRLSRRKGAHLLPDIITEVTKQRRDVIFVIVGDGPERKNLESRIRNQGLEEHVRMMGEVAHRDIVPYFRSADVFLMPSEEEGFPHVLLEAMAAGMLFVASDVGGVREITPPELQPFVVASGDVRGFATKLTELLALPPPQRIHMRDAAEKHVKRYDLQTVLSSFIRLFVF